MKPEEVNRLIDNEREWRRHILEKLSLLEKEVGSLKSRVAAMAALVGTGVSVFVHWLKAKLGVA